MYSDEITYEGECMYIILRTWTSNGLTPCVQTITVTDNDYPVFANDPADLTISCEDPLPPMLECLATDGCDEDLEYDSFTGGTIGTDETCILTTAYGPGPDWAVWIPQIGAGNNWILIDQGNFVAYSDGTAHIWGTIINTQNANQGFVMDIWLENGMNWEEWSALGRSYKDDLNLGAELHETWMYYEVANGFSTLTGIGEFEGDQLQIYHFPLDYYYGFQCGEAANQKNANNGLSGWFAYSGWLNGEWVYGSGDINTDKDCEDTNGCANADVTYIWSATDDCGHTSYNVQNIDVVDDVPPVVTQLESPIELPCDDYAGVFIEATDNCSTITITYVDEVLVPGCLGSILRTYTITDACGNFITAEQIINFPDDNGPFFINFPVDVTVECDAVPDAPPIPVTFDGACENPLLAITEEIISGDCTGEYIILRTYTLSDDCENTVVQTWTITVVDTMPPQLYNIPQGITLNCGDDVPDALVFALDNCDPAPVVGVAASTQPMDCGYIFIRTWTATDDCGNYTEQTEEIVVSDAIPPVFTFVPMDITIPCHYPQPLELATATDECSSVNVLYNDEFFANDCAGGYIRHYVAIDGCGNSTEAQQVITYTDDVAPAFITFPQDVAADCENLPDINDLLVQVEDNCNDWDLFQTIEYENGNCQQSYTILVTWTVEDNCGNSTSQTWTIDVTDTTAPVIYGVPLDGSINCNDPVPDAQPFALDDCSENVLISLTAATVQMECGY
ncbi:MAG: hypothetical protein SH856_15010, partial [Flavobacteriales bacterium]|nr:hypothetical protein [Flavobacteriales bacterium]